MITQKFHPVTVRVTKNTHELNQSHIYKGMIMSGEREEINGILKNTVWIETRKNGHVALYINDSCILETTKP